MVATRRSASPSLSEGSTVSVSTSGVTAAAKKVVFAPSVGNNTESMIGASAWRRRTFPKPPKKFVKGTKHIHFHKKAPTMSKKSGAHNNAEKDNVVQRVKLLTGTLYIYKGRKAEFVRMK